MEVVITGLPEIVTTLNNVDNGIRAGMRRALFRIGALVKRTAVDYAPISPSTTMLKAFAKRLKGGGADANVMYVAGRKGRSGTAVKLTAFYDYRMNMLLSKDPRSTTRPMPGGLMKSIAFSSSDSHAEIFVPSNSPAGSYAFKIHELKGSKWKERGPGTQAKGSQADDKFIMRAITDNEGNIIAIMKDQIDKAIGGEV
jgi:hypothetical protein